MVPSGPDAPARREYSARRARTAGVIWLGGALRRVPRESTRVFPLPEVPKMHRRVLATAVAVAFLGAAGSPPHAGRTTRPNPAPRVGASPHAKRPARPNAPQRTVA